MALAVNHRFLVAALVGALMLLLASPTVEANREGSDPEAWLDKLTGFVLIQKGIETEGNFDLYLEQLKVVRSVFKRELKQGDLRGTYVKMNTFMEMLEYRLGGIRAAAAAAIWDLCYEVTPVALHDVERHRRGFALKYPEKLT